MKRIQKQYQRKIKINQNNDVFTTFQRQSKADRSPLVTHNRPKAQSFHQNQHDHIESLRSTLRSLAPVSMQFTKQFSRHERSSNEDNFQTIQKDEYKLRLDQLTKNLQQIASKCHFSSAGNQSSKTIACKQQKGKYLFEKSQTISRYQMNPSSDGYYKNTSNLSMQLQINRSHSFLESSGQKNRNIQSKSNKKQEKSIKDIKGTEKSPWGRNESKSIKKAGFSKKDVIDESLAKMSASKNLTKLFQKYEENVWDIGAGRERSVTQYKSYDTVYRESIHRSRITNILVSDHIYTASLDYLVKKTSEISGEYRSETVQSYRGGVEHIGIVNNRIYGCGRDYYIRSLDGNYFYRFDKIPISFSETQKTNHINVNFASNQLKLFDLEKREMVSTLLIEAKYNLMSKISKESYLGIKGSLFALDWRKRQHLVNLYKQQNRQNCVWLNDPFSRIFWYYCDGEIILLDQDFSKIKSKSFPASNNFVSYHWSRLGLNILAENKVLGYKVFKFDEYKQLQELDYECETESVNTILLRERQLVYGSKKGEIVIKHLRR